LVDQRGFHLVAQISGAEVHDSWLRAPIVEAIPAIRGCQATLANVRENCTPAVPMHHERTAPGCAGKVLLDGSRGMA